MTNRIIKFRAWDKDNNVMIKDVGVSEAGSALNQWNEHISNCELMEFTGLLDKNGKEIYEGDIVKYLDYDTDINHRNKGGYNDEDKGIGKVKWKDTFGKPGFQIEVCKPHKNKYEYRGFDMVKIEIIGNIWENPELLK